MKSTPRNLMADMESLRNYELWTPARDHIAVAAAIGDDAPSSVRGQECPRHKARVVRTREGKLMTVAGCGDAVNVAKGLSVPSRNQDSGRYQRDDRSIRAAL